MKPAYKALFPAVLAAAFAFGSANAQESKDSTKTGKKNIGVYKTDAKDPAYWGWGAPPIIDSPDKARKILRYSAELATQQDGNKKPEVYDKILTKIGMPYRKGKGSIDDRYQTLKTEFDRILNSIYDTSMPYDRRETEPVIEDIYKIVTENLSSEDRVKFERDFGFNPDSGIWVLISR